MDNEMLVGIAGDRIVRQTCFAFSEIFTLDKNNNLTRKHIFTQIIPKLIELLTEHELLYQVLLLFFGLRHDFYLYLQE